jgi:drug/metabolite transporter (DMT)-like permease
MNQGTSVIPRMGYLYVVIAALLWAVSGVSGKFLFQRGVTPMELVQLRVTLASAILFVWLFFAHRERLRIARRDILYFVVLGAIGMATLQFTYFYAISKINVAVAILLEYLAPAFIAIHAVVFAKERLTRMTLTALGGSLAGCYLAVGAYNFNLLAMNWQGIVAGIIAAISYAWYAVHGERGMRRYDPWTVLFYALLFAGVCWNIVFPPLSAFRYAYSPIEWVWILYIGVFGTAIPFGLYSKGISLIRATRASVTATLEPIAAGFISFFFLGERLQPLQIVGCVLVIASILLLQVRKEYDDNTAALIRARRQDSGS